MNLFKKAQTATEYLIILAVVIIIALIVVGALGGIPGIGRGSSSRAGAAYWSTADVAITSFSINEGDAVILNVRNNMRNAITVNNITLATDKMTTINQVLAPGQTKAFSGTMTGANVCAAAGDSYSHDVTIVYLDRAANATYAFNGDSTKLDGVCAR